MTYKAIVYRVLIASPSDVVEERKVIPEVIYSWNAENSAEFTVVLLPVMWETHSVPEMGDRPQAIINKQLVRNCDILVGTFWTRIGTYTGAAESGTVEEIEKFKESGKPIMLYFSSVPVIPDSVDYEQYARLKSFRKKCEKEALVYNYSSISELKEKLDHHLTKVVRDILNKGDDIPTAKEEPERRKRDSLETIIEQFKVSVLRHEGKWIVEKAAGSYNSAYGVLRDLDEDLLDFRATLGARTDEKTIIAIDRIMKESRTLQYGRHSDFWERGCMLFKKLKELADSIKN